LIKKVVIEEDGTIVVYIEQRKKLDWFDLRGGTTHERVNIDLWHVLTNNGFGILVYGFEGYGYARKNSDGIWYQIDIKNLEIQRPVGPQLPDSFILGQVISEQDWGKWVKDIKLERKGIFS